MPVLERRNPEIPCPAAEHHPHTFVCSNDMCAGWFLETPNIFHSRGLVVCCSCKQVWPCDEAEKTQGGTA